MGELSVINGNAGQKSFWSRDEGKVGAVFAGILGLGIITLLYKALPYAITFISGTADLVGQLWRLAALGIPLAALFFVLMNPKFQLLISYMFKSVMWHLTNMFIDLDPVGIIKGYLGTLDNYIKDMSEQMGILNGHIQRLTDKINKYIKEKGKLELQVKAGAKDMAKYKAEVVVAGRQITRIDETIAEYESLRTKMNNAYTVLCRVQELSKIKFADMTNAVDMEIDKRETGKAVGGVLNSAMKILRGGEGKELYDRSMEKMVNDYSLEMGRLENFLQETKSMFVSFDLEDEASAQKTLAMIEQWEKEGVDKTLLIEQKPTREFITTSASPMAYAGNKSSATDDVLNKILQSK